jgi:2-polyprenyl-3-methyl-5-hydroxy-6-metoxy-1,4-benzoquinol methylase
VDDDAERHGLSLSTKIGAMSDAQSYYDEYWSRPDPPPVGDPLAPRRLEIVLALLRAARARRVLDAGSGAGELVGALAAEGFEVLGMEVAATAVEQASARHPECEFVRHSIEELPWPVERGSFDAVVSFEVIEHLLRPRNLFEGAQAALAPGGRLAVSTPYHGLAKSVAVAALRFDEHFAVEGDHIRFFSDRALERLAAKTGFDPERIHHLGRWWPLWANSLLWARRR